MGGEKLKVTKIYRLSWAVCLTILFFSINLPNIFAQSGTGASDSAIEQEIDPIRTAEQALTFREPNPAAPAASIAPSSSLGAVIRTLLMLILVAAAIYGIVFFIKKAARKPAAQDQYLKILASTHLGSNRYVHVISLGSKAWLVGTAEGGINLISEVNEKEILDSMLLDASKKSVTPGQFMDFKAILGRMGINVKPPSAGADNIRKRRDRLKGF